MEMQEMFSRNPMGSDVVSHRCIFQRLRFRKILSALSACSRKNFFVGAFVAIVWNGQWSKPAFRSIRKWIKRFEPSLVNHACILAWCVGSDEGNLILFCEVDKRTIVGIVIWPEAAHF